MTSNLPLDQLRTVLDELVDTTCSTAGAGKASSAHLTTVHGLALLTGPGRSAMPRRPASPRGLGLGFITSASNTTDTLRASKDHSDHSWNEARFQFLLVAMEKINERSRQQFTNYCREKVLSRTDACPDMFASLLQTNVVNRRRNLSEPDGVMSRMKLR